MPTQAPSELESQYRAMREVVGLLDRSDRGKLDVLGPDSAEYLQGQVTNDVQALEPGRGCYAALLSPKGRILGDMRLLVRSPEEIWLDTEASSLAAVRSNLDMYKIGRRVEIRDRTEDRSILSLIGPGAREVAGANPPAAEHAFVESEIAGAPVLVVRTDVGVDLLLEATAKKPVRLALAERGALAVTEAAAEVIRVERGRPRYGVDMTEDNLPGEMGLEERAVSFTKGCYVGQEPVARMHYRGHPNRHLRGLRLSSPAAPGQPLLNGEREVGALTSACLSPTFGPIGLAIVRREVEPGQEVSVGETALPAEVVTLPFEKGE
jgi:tRNA-modifying protein YgfZ